MKLKLSQRQRSAGFTLTEVITACAVASLMMGGLLAGAMALNRSFDASDRYARAEGDINRLVDYVARDIQNATNINPTANGTTLLTVTKGDFYDRRGTPTDPTDDRPNSPTIGRYGAVYGSSPMTIKYIFTGSRIRREITQVDSGVPTITSAWIADDVAKFSVSIDSKGVATVNASFATRYGPRIGDIQGATNLLSKQIYPRNPRT